MMPTRENSEATIQLLAEHYPKCFFIDPKQRLPLKKNITGDLQQDGVPVARVQLISAIEWYQSHYGYQHSLQAGVKRIDLLGKETTPVTEQEAIRAQNYIRERKERQPQLFTKPTEEPMKITKPSLHELDPLASVQTLLDGVRNAMTVQPEALRCPLAVAGLRVVIAEIEKTIGGLAKETTQ